MRTHTRAILVTAGLAGAAAMLTACGEPPVNDAMLEASLHLTAPGAEGDADDPLRAGAEKSIEILKPWADDFDAAGVLTALAELGVATAEIERVRGIESEVAGAVRLTRTTRAVWLAYDAHARAARGVNIDDEVTQIDALIAELSDELETASEERSAIESRLAGLNAEIADLESQAAAERDAAGEIQLRLNNMPGDEAVPAAEKVRDHILAADRLDIQAARKTHTRNSIRSEAYEIQLRAEGLETRIAVLRQIRADAKARAAAADRDAREASELAANARTTLLSELGEARGALDDELVPALDALAGNIRGAIARARSASGPVRGTGSLEAARGGQMLGFVYWRKAAALQAMAQLERSIGETLGDNAMTNSADRTEQAAREAHASGAEAFAAAASALSSVRAESPNTQESLRTLSTRLERFGRTEFGELPNLEPEATEGFDDDDDPWADDSADEDAVPDDESDSDEAGTDESGDTADDDTGEDSP